MFRPEYDAVVAFHPYRTYQPWDNGGRRIMYVDGVNGDIDEANVIRERVEDTHRRLLAACEYAGIEAFPDNHCGFTMRIDETADDPAAYYHIRFSDSSMSVWLMSGPPEADQ